MQVQANVVLDGVTYYGEIFGANEHNFKEVVDMYKTSLQNCTFLSLVLGNGSTLVISGDKARQAVILIEKLG